MTPLLEALQAAQEVGLDAPKCKTCQGGKRHVPRCWSCDNGVEDHECYNPPVSCHHCHATGLDASDPFGLIGLAMVWLWGRGYDAWDVLADRDNPKAGRALKLVLESGNEPHDGTTPGRATALLRLVARVGGAS